MPNSQAAYLPFGDWRNELGTANLTDLGYTGHRHNNTAANDLGLIYMNARYYIPALARFASADTIVPNPSNPQSHNRFSYVQNNPIQRIDPTGHIDCEVLGTEDCQDNSYVDSDAIPSIQYDFTAWLAREMVLNANGSEIQIFYEIQTWAHRQLDYILSLDSASQAFVYGRVVELNTLLDLFGASKQWDIKREIEKVSLGIVLCGLDDCGWFDYSTVGNIHFGYIVAATGTASEGLSQFAGGLLEILEGTVKWDNWSTLFEDLRDFAAVEFGYYLFDTYGSDMTLYEFQQALTSDVRETFQPPPQGFYSPFVAQPQTNYYPPGHFDCTPPRCQENIFD